jgi:hypothetical protein
VFVPGGGGEIAGDSPQRRVEILTDPEELHATWSRFGPHRERGEGHKERNDRDERAQRAHSDSFARRRQHIGLAPS